MMQLRYRKVDRSTLLEIRSDHLMHLSIYLNNM